MTQTTAAAGAIEFVGRRKPLFWLLIKNTLLTILTIGIYRFWAKTHVRRYYWNNISVIGDRLEYLGRPVELLIGFLIAIAILLPLVLVTSGLALAMVYYSPGLEFLSNIAFLVAIFWLGNFALYRMRRYRLTRTAWRGIRAGQTGSAIRYAFLRMGLTAIAFLSLGFAYPWTRVVLHRYVIPNSWFGNTNLEFTGTARQLFRYWIPVQLVIVAVVGFLVLFAGQFVDTYQTITDIQEDIISGEYGEDEIAAGLATMNQAMSSLAAVTVPAYFVVIIAFVWFRVTELRYIFSNITLAGAQLTSNFRFRSVVWRGVLLFLTTMLLMALLLLVVTAAGVVFPATPAYSALAMVIIIPPVFLILFTLQHLVFWKPLLATFCAQLTIDNPHELERIAQSTSQDPKYGEGLADALAVDILPV